MPPSDFPLITPSSEFVAICQAQVTLLTQTLQADWSGVYVTEGVEGRGEANLIPVVVYPQTDQVWQSENRSTIVPEVKLLTQSFLSLSSAIPSLVGKSLISSHEIDYSSAKEPDSSAKGRYQIVLPLIYKEVMMGVLVTGKKDRDWTQNELLQIEKIARTLAIAYLLDQRQNWYKNQLNQQKIIRKIERDRLDDLLHQLRNPLTALRTFGKLLLKRILPEDTNQSVVKGMIRESDRLQELLQEFEEDLDAVITEDNSLLINTQLLAAVEPSLDSNSPFLLPGNTLNLTSILVEDVLEPLLLSAQAIAQEKGIKLTANIAANLSPIQANYNALREVLSNLIDNSLKYTPSGGKINLTVELEKRQENQQLQSIEIKDTGYGIPQEDQKHIFERHYRGIQAEGDIFGTGLGLAIAKDLIEQMQGEIELISPNQWSQKTDYPGTTLRIWLPVSKEV